jgi:hypothetical protein
MAQRLGISSDGRMTIPVSVRNRWQANAVLAEDHGDHIVLRAAPDDPVAAAVGVFATQIGVLGSEEAKRLDREDEIRPRATPQ